MSGVGKLAIAKTKEKLNDTNLKGTKLNGMSLGDSSMIARLILLAFGYNFADTFHFRRLKKPL